MRCSSRRIASGRMRINRPIGIAAPISSRRSAIAAIVTRLAIFCLDSTTNENSPAQSFKAGRPTTSRPIPTGASAVGPTSSYEGYLSIGHADGRGSAGGPMAEVVDNSLSFLSDADIHAIITYLKSVPANSDGTDIAAAPTPSAPREVSEQPAPPDQSGPACKSSKAPASVVMGSTARVPSRIMRRSSAGEP